MAMVQGMQTTVLCSRIRQLQPPHLLSDFSSNFSACRGNSDDKQKSINQDVRRQRFTRSGALQGLRCRRISQSIGPVYCLKTTEVEQQGKNVDAGAEGRAVKKGLSSLDAYFDKLHATRVEDSPGETTAHSQGTANGVPTPVQPPSTTGSIPSSQRFPGASETGNVMKDRVGSHEGKKTGGHNALDSYFNKLRPSEPGQVTSTDEEVEKALHEAVKQAVEENDESSDKEDEKKLNIKIISASNTSVKEEEEAEFRELMEELEKALEQQAASGSTLDRDELLPGSSWGLQAGNSNSYVVNGLVAVNIAVYLFGLASPLEVQGMTDASIPFLYGAKVNELIVNGEWWRLFTPTFLHSGLLHLGLSTWALLEFGPAVESAYGTLGFSMICVIGGLYGNLLSFFHTPQGTVGGTGPIYALMATWMVYLLRNREIIGLEVAGDMIRKVVIFTAVSYALCNSLPVDDWTHLGAAAVGAIFGLLTCPLVQVNVHVEEVAENNDEDAMESYLLLNEGLHPYRLFLVFGLALAIFFALYSVGVPYATEFHFLHGGLGDEYW